VGMTMRILFFLNLPTLESATLHLNGGICYITRFRAQDPSIKEYQIILRREQVRQKEKYCIWQKRVVTS